MKLRTVFFGTPDISVPCVEALLNHPQIELIQVVSNPDKKSGRGHKLQSPPVVLWAQKNKIDVFQCDNVNKEIEQIKKWEESKIDLFIVFAFSQFLSDRILSIPKLGAFNIHTSLLPKYRGAAPIQYALLHNDEETGVSIQKMVKLMDAGDVCHSLKTKIAKDDTGETLYNKLKVLAVKALTQFVEMAATNSLIFTKQDSSAVSFAPTLKREDGLLDFKNENYEQILNKIRAFDPWPGVYTFLNGKRLKIFQISKSSQSLKPGELYTKLGTLTVGLTTGSIQLDQVQIEGKAKTSGEQLLNGLKGDLKIG